MALLRSASLSDLGPVIRADRVVLRTPQIADYPAWAELRAESRDGLHERAVKGAKRQDEPEA